MEYMYTIIEVIATKRSWLSLVKPLQRYANHSYLPSEYNQVLIRWTPRSWTRSSMQCTETPIVQEGPSAVPSCDRHYYPSCRCIINARYSSKFYRGQSIRGCSAPTITKVSSPRYIADLRSAVCDKGHV